MFNSEVRVVRPRRTITAIGRVSVRQDCIVPRAIGDKHAAELEAMEKFGLAYRDHDTNQSQSQFALSSIATVSVISLSHPVPVVKDPLTSFEGRTRLQQFGWEAVESAYDCSVEGQRMMQHQCMLYYQLLIHQRDQLLELTKENYFSHAQKAPYYACLQEVCSKDPFAFWNGLRNFEL